MERDISKLETVKAPFPRMSYDDAVKALQAKGSEIQWGGDFGGPDETMITEGLDRPLMVDRYPTQVKAFYFEPDPDRPELALGVDVIAPEGYGETNRRRPAHPQSGSAVEAAGGAQASAGSVQLVYRSAQIRQRPHAGFGMGIERFVAWMCGLEHIRETIPYPRMLYRTKP